MGSSRWRQKANFFYAARRVSQVGHQRAVATARYFFDLKDELDRVQRRCTALERCQESRLTGTTFFAGPSAGSGAPKCSPAVCPTTQSPVKSSPSIPSRPRPHAIPIVTPPPIPSSQPSPSDEDPAVREGVNGLIRGIGEDIRHGEARGETLNVRSSSSCAHVPPMSLPTPSDDQSSSGGSGNGVSDAIGEDTHHFGARGEVSCERVPPIGDLDPPPTPLPIPSHGETVVEDDVGGASRCIGEDIHHLEARREDSYERAPSTSSLDPPPMSPSIPSHGESMVPDVVVGDICRVETDIHHFGGPRQDSNVRSLSSYGRVNMSSSMALPGSPDGGISDCERPGGLSGIVGEETHPLCAFSGSGGDSNGRLVHSNERVLDPPSMALLGSLHGAISTTGGPGGLSDVLGEETHHLCAFSGPDGISFVRVGPSYERVIDPPSMALPGSPHGAISTTGGPGGLSDVVGENTHHLCAFSGSGGDSNGRVGSSNERVNISSSMALPGSSNGAISTTGGPGGLSDVVGEDTHPLCAFSGSDEDSNVRSLSSSERVPNPENERWRWRMLVYKLVLLRPLVWLNVCARWNRPIAYGLVTFLGKYGVQCSGRYIRMSDFVKPNVRTNGTISLEFRIMRNVIGWIRERDEQVCRAYRDCDGTLSSALVSLALAWHQAHHSADHTFRCFGEFFHV